MTDVKRAKCELVSRTGKNILSPKTTTKGRKATMEKGNGKTF